MAKLKGKKRKKRPSLDNRSRLNVFLILLLRDHLPYGTVEGLLSVVDQVRPEHAGKHLYANKKSDAYIDNLSKRLWKD